MIKLIHGNCLDKLKELEANSVDAIVTDPPYGLEFMGKEWDKGVPGVEFWVEMMRVLKPGGHLLSFSGTRTYHRMATAIEDAGFEIRDMIEWVYGSGFPKSLNIGKAVDKLQGNERGKSTYIPNDKNKVYGKGYGGGMTDTSKGTSEWEGWGTALKPAHEPICMARKPLAEKTVALNVLKYGTGGINIDESRVGTEDVVTNHGRKPTENGWDPRMSGGQKQEQTYGQTLGRFPANLIHDNSEEVRECFPETKSGSGNKNTGNREGIYGILGKGNGDGIGGDSGNASRFFKSIIYQAKASKSERNKGCEGLELRPGGSNAKGYTQDVARGLDRNRPVANNHPTVKPIALMSYLIKMVTPEGGTVLDPFMGSGSTGVAAKENGYNFIGIEMEAEYIEIAKARIDTLDSK